MNEDLEAELYEQELALEADMPECEWFALCTRKAITFREHPVLGQVPICGPCDEKVESLS